MKSRSINVSKRIRNFSSLIPDQNSLFRFSGNCAKSAAKTRGFPLGSDQNRLQIDKIPGIFPDDQGIGCGEWFAADCVIHHSVLRFRQISENRLKSARARAICASGWTRRTSRAALIGEIGRILSGRDFGRSIGRRRAASGRLTPKRAACGSSDNLHLRRGESLPSLRRQSDECSRTAGAPSPCPRRRFSHEH